MDSRGVWKWTDELGPANLAQVKSSLIKGQQWAHLPWREITLVHAVQKPLEPPDITALTPGKNLTETFATVSGTIKVDAPSSARIQLLSSWTDPVDDPPDLPSSETKNSTVCEIVVPENVSPVNIIDSSTNQPPKHEFYDTKHHRVEYTPVAVTRDRKSTRLNTRR